MVTVAAMVLILVGRCRCSQCSAQAQADNVLPSSVVQKTAASVSAWTTNRTLCRDNQTTLIENGERMHEWMDAMGKQTRYSLCPTPPCCSFAPTFENSARTEDVPIIQNVASSTILRAVQCPFVR